MNDLIEEYKLLPEQPIGILDSGLGGISVLKRIQNILPGEDCIFFGDSAHAPYGDKTLTEIQKLTEDVVRKLLKQRVKAIVIACNTASSAAGSILRSKYPWLPIIAIEPALKPAVLHKPNGRILVLATTTTIREKKFQNLLASYAEKADIIGMPLPGLADFVEKGELDSPNLRKFLQNHFSALENKKIDCAVLGCTHYPFVRPVIQELLGPATKIFDGAGGTARQLRRQLKSRGLLNSAERQGNILWQNSNTDKKFIELSKLLYQI